MTEQLHPSEDELQDGLDGRLSGDRQDVLERHLRECESCRRSYEALGWTKRQAARLGVGSSVPAPLAEAIAHDLDAEDSRTGPARSAGGRRWWLWGTAAALAVLLGLFWWTSRTDLTAAVASDYGAYTSGKLALTLQTADVKEMERFFAENGILFETRVFDLGMMDYALVGGRVHRLQGRPSAFFIYRAKDGRRLLCQMYGGTVSELPAPDFRRQHNGIDFGVYHREGLTLVFWPEGDVVCVLVGEGASEAVVQLAFAKAVKVAG